MKHRGRNPKKHTRTTRALHYTGFEETTRLRVMYMLDMYISVPPSPYVSARSIAEISDIDSSLCLELDFRTNNSHW